MSAELSADDARRLALRAQGLLGAPDRAGGVAGLLRTLGAVQLDTISVLARSHELVAYARLGAVGRAAVERAYWGRPARAFEYWSHGGCVLPIETWPWFAFRRRHHARRHAGPPLAAERAEVLSRLTEGGPLTATELGGARRGGPWWDWSPLKQAAERLLATGQVVCVERRGWRRLYDLPERAIPERLRALDPSDEECAAHLVSAAGAALGVATVADLADHHRMLIRQVAAGLPASGLERVRVRGWPGDAWAHPEALAALGRGGRHRTTLLSPFDSLVWDRARAERIFGFAYRLEAYVPRERRVHGYFAMPLLAGGRLAGRADPAREGRTLVARRVSLAGAGAASQMAQALERAAEWVGCSAVRVERVEPPALGAPLRAALRATG